MMIRWYRSFVMSKLSSMPSIPAPERDDQRTDVLAGHDLVETGLLDVQDLAAQRQDRLEAAVAALLRGAARRVALDDEELAACRIPLLAVRELPGQRQTIERALPDDEVAGLASRLARASGREALLDDPTAVAGILLEVLGEAVGDRGLDLALDLGVAELGLGLALELRIGELDADHRSQALADVVAGEVAVVGLEHAGLAGPIVERARERGPEARDVRPAIDRVDVVGEGEDVLGVRVVVLDRDLDLRPAKASIDVDRLVVEGLLVAVEVPHERLEAALEVERSLAIGAPVDERDPDALGEVRGLAQVLRDRVELELGALEHQGVGAEPRLCPTPVALRSDLLDRTRRLSALVLAGCRRHR